MRRYFRRGSMRGPLPGEVGSDEFMAAYQACLAKTSLSSTAKIDGSLGLLITEYYGSRAFARPEAIIPADLPLCARTARKGARTPHGADHAQAGRRS